MTINRPHNTAMYQSSLFRDNTVYRCYLYRCGFKIIIWALLLFNKNMNQTKSLSNESHEDLLSISALWPLFSYWHDGYPTIRH